MPAASELPSVLDRQLLLQLGERLRSARKKLGLTTTQMAERSGMSRMTLRAVEAGEPAPTMGSYLRVMSVLGVSQDLALLASDALRPLAKRTAGVQRPDVPVGSVSDVKHEVQDLQSLMLHQEAVRLMRERPELIQQALETLDRWRSAGSTASQFLWDEWSVILHRRAWRRALAHTQRSKELRQASPLPTVLPPETRRRILDDVKRLKEGLPPKATVDLEDGEELTSEAAAKLLHVSRSYLNTLADSGALGEMPRTAGKHRRFSKAALLDYKARSKECQTNGLDTMMEASRKLGLYEDER